MMKFLSLFIHERSCLLFLIYVFSKANKNVKTKKNNNVLVSHIKNIK